MDQTNADQDSKPEIGNYQHENIITNASTNLIGPTIMEGVEPNVQRHVKTQPESSRLVCIFLRSRERDNSQVR